MSASNEHYRPRVPLKLHAFLCSFLLFFFPCKQGMAQANSRSGPAFTARLMNIEAATNARFTYNTTLHNRAPLPRIYELSAELPPGWDLSFKVEGIPVRSLNVDSGRTRDIIIEVTPSTDASPGKYNIPVLALAGSDSSRLALEAVVKGTYGVTLTTPSGRLSDDVTEGSRKEIRLQVKNTGNIILDNLDISAQAPPQWEATFAPASVTQLGPGKDTTVIATLNVPDKTIAGDYVTTFSVKNTNASSNAAFRITVKTSVLTGWLGILVILAALGAVYYLIRKYGRR